MLDKNSLSNRGHTMLGMTLAMVVALLDVHLLSASLPTLAERFGYRLDEVATLQTVYIISEIIAFIFISSLSKKYSHYLVFRVSIWLFLVSSIACAIAPNLLTLILSRAIQGFSGGALIALCLAAIYLLYKEDKQVIISSRIASATTLIPILAPIMGGFLTDELHWRFLFLQNIPYCCLVLFLTNKKQIELSYRTPNITLSTRLLTGFLLSILCIFLTLELGVSQQWPLPLLFLGAFAIGLLVLCGKYEQSVPTKVLYLSLLKEGRLSVLMCTLAAFSASHFFYIYFLIYLGAEVFDYSAKGVAILLLVTGLAQVITSFFVNHVIQKTGLILCAMLGASLLAFSTLLIPLEPSLSPNQLILPQLLRGASFMLLVVPLQNLIMETPKLDKKVYVSAQFNLVKNLGGAIAIAIASSLIALNTMPSLLTTLTVLYWFEKIILSLSIAMMIGLLIVSVLKKRSSNETGSTYRQSK